MFRSFKHKKRKVSNDYHHSCDHAHFNICTRCQALYLVLSNFKTACDSGYVSLTSEDHAAHNIHLWKAHQLRYVNQDSCKQDILSLLDEGAVMIPLDWVMKYLPRKYRESQTEWYAKRCLPWHISVVTRKSGNVLHILAIIHIFEATKQDSNAVICIIDHVLKVIKDSDPLIPRICVRITLVVITLQVLYYQSEIHFKEQGSL